MKHPEQRVLVIDFAEEGDLTKRFFGGADAAKEKIDAMYGGIFNLLDDAQNQRSGLTSWFFSDKFDVLKHAVKLSDHNDNLPSNLYLISSGAYPNAEQSFSLDQRKRICQRITSALESSTDTWKLMCDT